MKIEILDINDLKWSVTLKNLLHDVYHLPEYVALEAQRTHTIPEAFLLEDEDRVFFIPYLLRSCEDIVDSTYPQIYDIFSPYGYPGILMSDAAATTPGFPDFALQEFCHTLQSKNICSAFLRLHPILSEKFRHNFSSNSICQNGLTVSVDLTLDEEQIWAKTRKGHQSTINKCMRLGLTARTVPFEQYMDEFITIYEETMDRVQAKDLYYFSRDYFTGLLNLGDQVHLGIVEAQDRMVCGSLFFESCGIVQAHLGGTKTEFLKQSPFNLLLHYMRLWAKARGNKYLHLGGGVGGLKDNLYIFKSGFSRQRHEFLTCRLIVDKALYEDLVQYRAKTRDKSLKELQNSSFFPGYRAS